MRTGRPLSKTGKSVYARTVTDRLTNAGAPDMYNYVAKRTVTMDEASAHGWHMFYDGVAACSRGHIAARYISNPAMCSDCNRENSGKAAIYPNTGGDLTAPAQITYVQPVANSIFEWDQPKQDQFIEAYINTCSVPDALKAIGAQMSHFLRFQDENAAFRERIERTEAKEIRKAQFYRAEAAALENDRMQQLQAQRKFPDSFGSGAQNGLGRAEIGSPEQIDAEFAQLLRGARRESGSEGQTPPAIGPGSSREPGPPVVADGKGRFSVPIQAGGVPAEDDAACDLVS